MLINKNNSYIMPYGAFELKATYQRNMLIGMGGVITIVFTILLTVVLYSIFNPTVKIKIDPETIIDGGVFSIPPITYILQKTPDINPGGNRKEIVNKAVIPVPVADSLFYDDNSFIATIDEKALLVGSGNEPSTGDELNLGFGVGEGVGYYKIGEEITPTTFVKVEQPPVMIQEYIPKYPRLCEIAGITGTVWIWALVDENGKIINAEVVKSSGTPALDEAALEAAYKNLFKPGIQNKRAIKVGVTYKVEFVLDN